MTTYSDSKPCNLCHKMLANRKDLVQAMTEKGFDYIVDRDEFRSSVEQECSLCLAFHHHASEVNLEDIRAQGLFDPEDIEGMDERDYQCMEPFRVLECSRSVDEEKGRGKEKLTRNIHLEVMPGRAKYDITSMRVAAWSADNRYHLDLEYDVFSKVDDPAGLFVETRPINHTVSSEASFETAKKWLSDCVEIHDICPKPRTILPTRIIEVGPDDIACRLRQSSDVDQDFYVALSYVWGGPQPAVLNISNHQAMLDHIDVQSLPKTIRDAITTTRKLSLRYLWIDALCIIQDDDIDKRREIGRMDDIFHNAYVTICAASATKCQVGFLEDKDAEFAGVTPRATSRLIFPCPNRRQGEIMVRPTRTYDPIMEPVNTRAWCFQERLLSPRVLTYGSWQMYWQCQSRQYCDGGDISRFEQAGTERVSMLAFTSSQSKVNASVEQLEQETLTIHENWRWIATEYNFRDVTDPEDKLPALAGVAKRYGEALIGDKYCAGLWKSQLIPTLAWQCGNPQPIRPKSYRAPTWSWASIDGEILWTDDALRITPDTFSPPEIDRCNVTPMSVEVPYGRVKSGELDIRGLTVTMNWDGTLHGRTIGSAWTIHPDIFRGFNLDGSTQEIDDFFDGWTEADKEVKYNISLHLQSKLDTTEFKTPNSDGTVSKMSVTCLRVTDIAALVLEFESATIQDGFQVPNPNKKRKTSADQSGLARKHYTSATGATEVYKRIGLMVFGGLDGVDDADTFFGSGTSQCLTIT